MNLPDDWSMGRRRCTRCRGTYHLSGSEGCACDEELEQLWDELDEHAAGIAAFASGPADQDMTQGAWLGIAWAETCQRIEDCQQKVPRSD